MAILEKQDELPVNYIPDNAAGQIDIKGSIDEVNINNPIGNQSEVIAIQGYLTEADILCIKIIEAVECESYVLWFIDFLIQKDRKKNYNYLTSCLLIDYP